MPTPQIHTAQAGRVGTSASASNAAYVPTASTVTKKAMHVDSRNSCRSMPSAANDRRTIETMASSSTTPATAARTGPSQPIRRTGAVGSPLTTETNRNVR